MVSEHEVLTAADGTESIMSTRARAALLGSALALSACSSPTESNDSGFQDAGIPYPATGAYLLKFTEGSSGGYSGGSHIVMVATPAPHGVDLSFSEGVQVGSDVDSPMRGTVYPSSCSAARGPGEDSYVTQPGACRLAVEERYAYYEERSDSWTSFTFQFHPDGTLGPTFDAVGFDCGRRASNCGSKSRTGAGTLEPLSPKLRSDKPTVVPLPWDWLRVSFGGAWLAQTQVLSALSVTTLDPDGGTQLRNTVWSPTLSDAFGVKAVRGKGTDWDWTELCGATARIGLDAGVTSYAGPNSAAQQIDVVFPALPAAAIHEFSTQAEFVGLGRSSWATGANCELVGVPAVPTNGCARVSNEGLPTGCQQDSFIVVRVDTQAATEVEIRYRLLSRPAPAASGTSALGVTLISPDGTETTVVGPQVLTSIDQGVGFPFSSPWSTLKVTLPVPRPNQVGLKIRAPDCSAGLLFTAVIDRVEAL